MATIYGAFRTDTTMTNAQGSYATAGSTFQISAYSTLTYNDGADPAAMAGDSSTNERPNDPTQTLAGNAIAWDYTIAVTDGTNVYQIGVIDYDINGNGRFNYPTAEQAYFLGFIGTIPPLNTTLTLGNITDNSGSAANSTFVPCLVSGSEILTSTGLKPVESIAVGDMVQTLRNGEQQVRWIGKRHISHSELMENVKLRPVRIRQGSLGNGKPKRDLLVSRQHRMMASSKIAQRMFQTNEILISAIHLTALPGIFVDETVEEVEYVHLLFNKHEVVFAEEAPTESLFTGPQALRAISPDAVEEIFTIFPKLATRDYVTEPALELPSGQAQKQFVARHFKNQKPLLELTSSQLPLRL